MLSIHLCNTLVFLCCFVYSVLHSFSVYCTPYFLKEKIKKQLANCQVQEFSNHSWVVMKINTVLMKVNTVLTKDDTVLKKVNCKVNIATRKQKLTIQATSRKQIPNRNIRNMAANFARTSGQLRAKLPVFCKHTARTIIWIKMWRRQKDNPKIYAHMSLLSAIHQHSAWTDSIS
jgi:hypothetical protein